MLLDFLANHASGTLAWRFAYHAIPHQFAKSALSEGSVQVSLENKYRY